MNSSRGSASRSPSPDPGAGRSAAPGTGTGLGSRAAQFWSARNARERRVLLVGGVLLLLLLLWLLAIAPALSGRARWQRELPQLRAQAAQVQAMSRQLEAAPPRASSSAPPPDKAALGASLAAQGLKPQGLELQPAGGGLLVRLTLADVSFSALAEWLQQQQRSAQLVVAEASITARDRVDRVDARLSLRRPP